MCVITEVRIQLNAYVFGDSLGWYLFVEVLVWMVKVSAVVVVLQITELWFTGVDQNIILNIISSFYKSLQTFDLMLLGILIFAFVNVDNKLVEVVLVVDEYCRLKCSPV